MRLLYENETVTEGVRLGRRGEILATARDALESTLGAMPGLGLCVSSGENELHRERKRRVDNGCIDIDNLTDVARLQLQLYPTVLLSVETTTTTF